MTVAKRPALRQLTECLEEIRRAAHQVNLEASSLYGAIESHCDVLDLIRPGMGDTVRKLTTRYYERLQAAQQRLREL